MKISKVVLMSLIIFGIILGVIISAKAALNSDAPRLQGGAQNYIFINDNSIPFTKWGIQDHFSLANQMGNGIRGNG